MDLSKISGIFHFVIKEVCIVSPIYFASVFSYDLGADKHEW